MSSLEKILAVILVILIGAILLFSYILLFYNKDLKLVDYLYRCDRETDYIPKKRLFYRSIKRCFDICFSFIYLMLLAPTLLFLSLAVKFEDPGPAFVRIPCVGYKRKRIYCYKFRLFRLESSGDTYAYTQTGKFIRRISMDNLPMLFNILKGDMTFIGLSRLHYPIKDNSSFRSHERLFEYEKPGMVNLNGALNTLGVNSEQADRMYLKSRSIYIDLKILGFVIRNSYVVHDDMVKY